MACDVPSWVNLIGWMVALIVAVLLYRDARVKLRDIMATVASLRSQVAALEAPGAARAHVERRAVSVFPPPPASSGAPSSAPRTKPAAPELRPAPDSESIRARFHAEADARDARDAAQGAQRGPMLPPPAPEGAPVIGPVQRPAPATAALPSAAVEDDGDRETGEEGTRMWERPAVTTTVRPPHAPPRPIRSARPTMVGGLDGAKLERPQMSAARTAEAFRKAHPSSPTLVSEGVEPPPPPPSAPRSVPLEEVAQLDAATLARVDAMAARFGVPREEILVRCAERGTMDLEALALMFHALGKPANDETTVSRETLTPTEPSMPAMDARVERRWHEKIAAAQDAGQHVQHCHGERCPIGACACRCDGCIRINGLLVEARREVLGRV